MELNLALINSAKNGDDEAIRVLYEKYQPVVFKLKQQYFLKAFDYDDWLQTGLIICYYSTKTFDSMKGMSFGNYFKMKLSCHIISLIRQQNAYKRTIDQNSVSLEGKIAEKGSIFNYKEDNYTKERINYIYLRDIMEGFSEQLSPFEVRVFDYFLQNKSLEEVLRIEACSDSKVNNAMDRIKRKMKDYLDIP